MIQSWNCILRQSLIIVNTSNSYNNYMKEAYQSSELISSYYAYNYTCAMKWLHEIGGGYNIIF